MRPVCVLTEDMRILESDLFLGTIIPVEVEWVEHAGIISVVVDIGHELSYLTTMWSDALSQSHGMGDATPSDELIQLLYCESTTQERSSIHWPLLHHRTSRSSEHDGQLSFQ